MSELRDLIRAKIDAAQEEMLLTEYPCDWCGLTRLFDHRDHHVCRVNLDKELKGLAAFL